MTEDDRKAIQTMLNVVAQQIADNTSELLHRFAGLEQKFDVFELSINERLDRHSERLNRIELKLNQ